MRSEQDRRHGHGPGPAQHRYRSPNGGGNERFEGQYEKDPWRPDWRRDAPPRGEQEFRGRGAGGAGYGRAAVEGRADRTGHEEPYEPSEGYEPFEPGHPREEGVTFGAGRRRVILAPGSPGAAGRDSPEAITVSAAVVSSPTGGPGGAIL